MGDHVRDFRLRFFDDLDARACSATRRWLDAEAKGGRRVSIWRAPPNGTLSDVALIGDLSAS